jgi:hypothetical protein
MVTSAEVRELRPAAGIGISLRQQAWLLGVSGRWAFLILGLVAILMLLGLSDLPRELPRTFIVAMLALLGGVVWAVMVWHGEGPSRRSYHWSLPVRRPVNDLVRVGLGAAYLLGVCTVLAGIGAMADALNGTFDRFTSIGPAAWANFFLAPLIVYFLVIPAVLWSEYAITRWVFVAYFVLGLLAVVLSSQGYEPLAAGFDKVFNGETLGLTPALFDASVSDLARLPLQVGSWLRAVAFWLGLGLGLTLFTALFRPDDLRRMVRRGAQPVQ